MPMDDSFDPYDQWLGIPPAEQPAHYYRLLGLPIFSADAGRIQAEADRRMLHVRTFQLGKRSQSSQVILNELAAARVCLLSPVSKARYDAALSEWLASRLPVPPPVLPPEAPPLLPAEARALLPAEEYESAVANVPNAAAIAASWQAPTTRKTAYSGWLIIGCVVAITSVAMVALHYRQRPEQSALEGAAGRPVPSTLPASGQTGKADLGGKTVTIPSEVVLQSEQGDVNLHLARARVSGSTLKLDGETTADWKSPDDEIQWQFLIRKPGFFRVIVTYAADAASDGGAARLSLSGRPQPLTMPIRDTGGREAFASDQLNPMVMIDKSERYTLSIQAAQKPGEQLMTLRGVQLRRAPVRSIPPLRK